MTTMIQITGTHKETGNVVVIYRQESTTNESVQLMRECGYIVTIRHGYTVGQ